MKLEFLYLEMFDSDNQFKMDPKDIIDKNKNESGTIPNSF